MKRAPAAPGFGGRVQGFLGKALLGLVTGAWALLGSGCTSPLGTSPAPRLELWTLALKPTYTSFVDELRQGYETSHPGWTVEWLDLPERVIMQKLLASTAGGAPPDLINLGPNEAMLLAQQNALVAVDDLLTPEERARYFPQFLRAIHVGEHNYSIPWYVSMRVLMYNKQLFAQAGLDPEQPPRTQEDVERCARALRRTGCYGLLPSIRILNDWQEAGLPILDASGRQAAFVTQAHADCVERYARLLRDDIIPPETLTGDYQEAVRRFKMGTLGMLVSGPQFLMTIRKDAPDIYQHLGVAPLAPGKAGIVSAEVMHFVIPRSSRHPREAARLGTYLTSDSSQLKLCRLVPLLPSTQAAAKDSIFTQGRGQFPLEDQAMRLDAAQLAYGRDLTLALPNMTRLRLALAEAVEQAIRGRGDALTLLRQAAQNWDAVLAESPRGRSAPR